MLKRDLWEDKCDQFWAVSVLVVGERATDKTGKLATVFISFYGELFLITKIVVPDPF